MSKQDKAKAKRAKKNKQIIYMMLAASLVVVAVMGFNTHPDFVKEIRGKR